MLVERLLAEPDVGLVVPRLVYADGGLQHSVFRFPSPRQAASVLLVSPRRLRGDHGRRWWADGHHPHDRSTDIDWAIGAVHVIRASALRGAPYDERWFMYVEDVDCCWQLARRGWRRRLEADVEVVHVSNAAGAQAWGDQRTKRWTIATYDWYLRTFGRAALRRWAAVHSLAIVYLMGRSLPRGLRRDPAAAGLDARAVATAPAAGRADGHRHGPDRGSRRGPADRRPALTTVRLLDARARTSCRSCPNVLGAGSSKRWTTSCSAGSFDAHQDGSTTSHVGSPESSSTASRYCSPYQRSTQESG